MKKKWNWRGIISIFVLLSLLLAIVYVIFAIQNAPSEPDPSNPYLRVKSDYSLMLLQCVLGVLAMILPGVLMHRIRIEIP